MGTRYAGAMALPATSLTVLGLELPRDLHTLAGFRRWMSAQSDAPAPRPTGCFLSGKVHIDMSLQSFHSHEPVVDAMNHELRRLTLAADLGRFFSPPSLFVDQRSALCTEPDGFLVLWSSLKRRVRINPERASELLGVPDMTLEVVSRSSARKDLHDLVDGYAAAGVKEYWIADARGERVDLSIRVLQRRRYRVQPADDDGWIASPLFDHAFRLVRFTDKAGWTDFRLESRAV